MVHGRIQRECQYFDLDDFIDDLTETYSHGMRQRLVFAAALLHDPPVLVIDEPMVGLDPRSVRTVKDRLRQAAGGTTIFMSTHTLASPRKSPTASASWIGAGCPFWEP